MVLRCTISDFQAKFDVIQLAYALLIHFQTCGAAAGIGRTEAGGQSKMPSFNFKVVERALAVVFGEQMDNGLWPQVRDYAMDSSRLHCASLQYQTPFLKFGRLMHVLTLIWPSFDDPKRVIARQVSLG